MKYPYINLVTLSRNSTSFLAFVRWILNISLALLKGSLMLFTGLSFNIYAQINHVPNPSFEKKSVFCPTYNTSCPGEYGIVDFWDGAGCDTPDYYHSCGNAPQNQIGYQNAKQGQAYAGLFAYNSKWFYREAIQVNITPLEVGKEYEVSMYVSLANYSGFAVDGLGVFFYNGNLPSNQAQKTKCNCNFDVSNIVPQISFSSYGPISDTANWILVTGKFTADLAHSYIAIGCFKTDADLNKKATGHGFKNGQEGETSAYYYIDSVSVIPTGVQTFCVPPTVTVSASPTAICNGA